MDLMLTAASLFALLVVSAILIWSFRRPPNEGKEVEREWFDSIK